MTVTIEPYAIGSLDGARVYLLVRRGGRHKNVEQMPKDVTDHAAALACAAKRWGVPEREVKLAALQVVEMEP